MNRLYRAIVIDPAARTIEEVQASGIREETVRLVGADALDWFPIAEHDLSFDYGWVDEGGLSRERPIHAFLFSKRTFPTAGRCVLYGVSKEGGGTCDALFPLPVLRQEVSWLGLILPSVSYVKAQDAGREVLRTAVSFRRL